MKINYNTITIPIFSLKEKPNNQYFIRKYKQPTNQTNILYDKKFQTNKQPKMFCENTPQPNNQTNIFLG